jgi:hypothetical protein
MEGQTPAQNHPQQQPTGPWHQSAQPLYPAYAPPPPARQWFPIAVIAAIIIAGALIAAAIVIAGGDKTSPPAAEPSTTAEPAAGSTESTATCRAWRTTSAEIASIPPLPGGADFTTPNIDALIGNQNVASEKALDGFEPKIAPNDPPQVVSAAKGYIAAKRTDMAKAAAHTVTEADDTAVDTSLADAESAVHIVKYHGANAKSGREGFRPVTSRVSNGSNLTAGTNCLNSGQLR